MAERLEGKVALITGAARGQGRSHAITLARAGADIIALDICKQIESNPYPLSTPADLAETASAVEALGRKILTAEVDVRKREEIAAAVAEGLDLFGHIDVVVANAGIAPYAMGDPDPMDFIDAVDVDLIGVINTVAVSIPHLADFAAIVVTGSTAAMMPNTVSNPMLGPGAAGYGWSKSTLMGLVEQLALHLAPRFIRVNCVHPTNVNTHLLLNDANYQVYRPDLENPTLEDAIPGFTHFQAMPIPYVESIDVSNLVLYLASDEARYVTGQQIRVDAGSLIKFPDGPL
jgi:SDR family mycofactocin-dependent oxidoreductase